MKITRTKFAAATFGAALTSLYSAPELNAQIIDINFDPGAAPFFAGPGTAASNPLNAIEFTNVVSGSYNIPGVANAAVGVFNDGDYGVGIFNAFANLGFNGGISGMAVAQPGDFFTSGASDLVEFEATETGIRYIGFVAGGSVGWFSIDLGDAPNDGSDVVFTGGQFLVIPEGTEPPEPFGIMVGNPTLKGDVNQDGMVDFLDIGPFINVLSTGGNQPEADTDCSGMVDFLDIGSFIEILSGGTAGLAGLALGSTGLRRRRKATADPRGQESE